MRHCRFRHPEYIIEVDDCGKVYTRSRRRVEGSCGKEGLDGFLPGELQDFLVSPPYLEVPKMGYP